MTHLKLKPIALAILFGASPCYADSEMGTEDTSTAESETTTSAEAVTERPRDAGDRRTVEFTETQISSLDFSSFNAFKQSLLSVLSETLPADTLAKVKVGLNIVDGESDANAQDEDSSAQEENVSNADGTSQTNDAVDINSLYDGYFEAREREGFLALQYKRDLLRELGSTHGFEVTFSASAKDMFAEAGIEPIAVESESVLASGSGSIGILAAAAGIGLAAGGGGSSSGVSDGTYRNTIGGAFATEYSANDGLADHNILALNDYGYTGDGVKVAVVDSGIDATHQEFDGKTIYGKDFASSPTDFNRDENGHGTHVASIIAGDRDASGIRGMAYDATLYSYKLDNNGDDSLEGLGSDASIAAIFNQHVTDNISVSNNSWGLSVGGNVEITDSSETTIRSIYSSTITALRAAQTNGTIIVFSAGNSADEEVNLAGGLPYRIAELANEWLVVVSVDADGVEPAYTNRCGVSKAFCVTALGGGDTPSTEGVYAAEAGTDGYTRKSGTSMAAPHVSGLVAALVEKFPSLTAAQIVTRVKNGASLEGLTGYHTETTSNSSTAVMEAIFGHGLVNATASASTMGILVYPTGDHLSDGSVSTVSLPSGLSTKTVNQIMNSKFVAFDSFDGARFVVKGSEIFDASSTTAMPRFGSAPTYSGDSSAKLTFADQSKSGVYAISSGSASAVSGASSFWGGKANLFTHGLSPSGITVSQMEWKFGSEQLAVHPFVKTSDDGAVFGSGLSLRMTPTDNLSAFVGLTNEQSSLALGTTKASKQNVNNRAVNAGIELMLTEQWSAFGGVSVDSYRGVDPTPTSIGLSGAETIGSTAGLHWNSSSTDIAFGFYQPTTLVDGEVSMVTPMGRTQQDEIIWGKKSFDINSDTSSYPLFLSFSHALGDSGALAFNVKESELSQGKVGGAEVSVSFGF